MEFLDATLLTIVFFSFCAAAFNAAFAFGGAFILISGMSLVLPMSAILPLQSAVMVASQISRGWLLRTHVDWRFVGSFALGASVGAFAGAQLYLNMPQQAVAGVLATVMLWAAWGPKRASSPKKLPHSDVLIGGIHTFLSTAFSFGGLMQATLFRKDWERVKVAATIAFCALSMNAFKFPAYATSGFDYKPYLPYLFGAWIMAPLGTWVGRNLLYKMPESVFRNGFRVLLTLVACRLIWVAVQPLLD